MAEYNKAFFNLYETTFLVLKKDLGYEKALEIFRQIIEKLLGDAFDSVGFKKGNTKEFERIVGERDRAVGLRVEFPQVTKNKIVYRDYDKIFPGLQGHMKLQDLVDVLIGFKVRHILGGGWECRINKHLWKGDKYTEYIIEKK